MRALHDAFGLANDEVTAEVSPAAAEGMPDGLGQADADTPVVAVAGVTGAVGREMLLTLEQRAFPAERVVALASCALGRQEGRRSPAASSSSRR